MDCLVHPQILPLENTCENFETGLRLSRSSCLPSFFVLVKGVRWPGPGSQSACLRRKAGISKSSMPPEDSASTLAAAWVRLVRHTLGTARPP